MKNTEVSEKKPYVRGLEGVSAGSTKISYVDGVNGILVYSGYNIHEIAERVTFEEVAYMLWHDHDKLPNERQLERFRHALVKNMHIPFEVQQVIRAMPDYAHPMAVLRTAVSALGALDQTAEEITGKEFEKKAVGLLGRIPAIVAAMIRLKNGERVIEPDIDHTFAENFLYMIHEKWPTKDEARAFDTLLVLHADHGFNASTFSARVTTSTLSDIYSAITTAIGTLKGPLHGGANQKVIEMLKSIDHPDLVEEYIDGLLDQKQRIMGFGHRVYRTQDPRAKHLREWAEKMTKDSGNTHLYEIAMKIEQTVMDRKGIYPNVDFYSAVVQDALKIPTEFYTCIFAASRTAGWMAHIREQLTDNRLIRPTSRYEGALDKKFIPMDERE